MNCFSQSIIERKQDYTIVDSYYNTTLHLNGYLDRDNTKRTESGNVSVIFEPMKSLHIYNAGLNKIFNPVLSISENDLLLNSESIRRRLQLEEETSSKAKALKVFEFVKDNRIHYDPAEDGIEAYEDLKELRVYGYGYCGNAATSSIDVAIYSAIYGNTWGLHGHVVSDLHFDSSSKGLLIDPDIEVFYLDMQNQDLEDKQTVSDDRFLIKRTSHYGKNSYVYNDQNFVSLHYDKYDYIHENRVPQYYSYQWILRPNEGITYSWDTAKFSHHIYLNKPTPQMKETVISNNNLTFSHNFQAVSLDNIIDNIQNLKVKEVDHHPNLHPKELGKSYFVIDNNLPFPVLNIDLQFKLQRATEKDSILVYISTDSLQWKQIYEADQFGTFFDSVNLYDEVVPLQKRALYRYFLKFEFYPNDSVWSCGIDSLHINTTFQSSRFFLPQLRLGENSISYTDDNGDDPDRNVKITIEWEESYENKPPNKIKAPVFPANQSVVDSLYFAFTWEPATDDDGDAIVDYEFMLSDDPRMLFPLSPNFNKYVWSFRETVRPYYKVRETGWLNDGQTYYWRVRAMDARRAWSEWSDTWSFTAHGVMRPLNGKAEIVGQSIVLSWENNTTGKKPDYYKIYSSNEMNGFYPEQAVFFTTSDTNHFVIPFEKNKAPKSFYRISACDTSGQESLISDVIKIPYPYIYTAFDSIKQDSIFRMNLFSNEKFYPYFYYTYLEDWYYPVIFVDNKPDWLSYETSGILYSNDTDIARKMVFMDSIQRTVEISLYDMRDNGGVTTQTITFETTLINKKPALMLSDSIICEKGLFSAYITSTDEDIVYGDTNYYTIVQKPPWLNYLIKGDTILLSGYPEEKSVIGQKSLLSVLAVDTKNDSTTMDFYIHVTPHVKILSPIMDTAIEDETYSYSFIVDGKEDDINISFLEIPEWLSIYESNQFSGIPDIYNLNDTIMRLATFDKLCNVYTEHEIIISIQHVNHPPVITTTELPAIQNGFPYRAQIEAYDIDSFIEDVDLSYYMHPASNWLTIDLKTGVLSGIPFFDHLENLMFDFIIYDKQGASDSKTLNIPVLPPDIEQGKLIVQIVYSWLAENHHNIRIQSKKETTFRYNLYSIEGGLIFSSSNCNFKEGIFYLPIDMSRYPPGVYIFVAYEDNIMTHSIKFIK